MASTGQQSGSLQNKDVNPTGKQIFPESSTTKSGGDMGRQGQEAGTSVMDKAKETASGVGERLRETAGSVQDMARKAGDVASNVGHKAGETVSNVGSQMRNLAGTIRQSAPNEGLLGSAASTVAEGLEAGGRYLEEETLSDLGREATDLIRRFPLQAMLVGIGIGYLLARATRR
jgi:hypothetical protein